MNQIMAAMVMGLLGAYAPFALAAGNESNAHGAAGLIVFGVSLAALAYCGNKWRLWWFGFQVGDASGSEFISALKWSVLGVIVTVVSFGALALFG